MLPRTTLSCIALLLSSPGGASVADAFAANRRLPCHLQSAGTHQLSHSRCATALPVIGTGAASLLAGSVGGAIGVGVAYPLDTLKTKAQVYGQRQTQERRIPQDDTLTMEQSGTIPIHPSGTVCTTEDCYPIESPENDLVALVKLILEEEGIAGFFGGVKAMMIGQALIKSIAFSANAMALTALNEYDLTGVAASQDVSGGDGAATSFVTLLLAASFSGFVTSFLVAPVERVKVMMQAQSNAYANELECIQAVLENEGWTGLFSRGLGPTLARETPSYAIYFVCYGLLMQTAPAESLGSVAPLVCGAISGCACWIPVYPINVVKTLVQNTEGGDTSSALDVAMQLYQDEGVGAFFNGLTPKMLRASVNHAVTFYVYALVMDALA
ncbi:hypothetical protein ACHAXT_008579 [Thalassiosira profunda]